MKQIFDWLREQIRNRKSKDDFLEDRVWNHAMRVCIEIIDEAEAKWKAKCCEWKPTDKNLLKPYKSSCGKLSIVNPHWSFCPYCGENIKVVEK